MAKYDLTFKGRIENQATVDNATRDLNDGQGLWVVVTGKARSYMFRFSYKGKAYKIGMGSASKIKLDEARRIAPGYWLDLNRDVNAQAAKEEARAKVEKAADAALKPATFGQALDAWLNTPAGRVSQMGHVRNSRQLEGRSGGMSWPTSLGTARGRAVTLTMCRSRWSRRT
jgi:hypothetical protein